MEPYETKCPGCQRLSLRLAQSEDAFKQCRTEEIDLRKKLANYFAEIERLKKMRLRFYWRRMQYRKLLTEMRDKLWLERSRSRKGG